MRLFAIYMFIAGILCLLAAWGLRIKEAREPVGAPDMPVTRSDVILASWGARRPSYCLGPGLRC